MRDGRSRYFLVYGITDEHWQAFCEFWASRGVTEYGMIAWGIPGVAALMYWLNGLLLLQERPTYHSGTRGRGKDQNLPFWHQCQPQFCMLSASLTQTTQSGAPAPSHTEELFKCLQPNQA